MLNKKDGRENKEVLGVKSKVVCEYVTNESSQ